MANLVLHYTLIMDTKALQTDLAFTGGSCGGWFGCVVSLRRSAGAFLVLFVCKTCTKVSTGGNYYITPNT